jgi:hypothetical protein
MQQANDAMSVLQQKLEAQQLQMEALQADKSILADRANTQFYAAQTKRMDAIAKITATPPIPPSPAIPRTVGPPAAHFAPPQI